MRPRSGRDSSPPVSGELAEVGTGRPSAHLGKLRPETGGISFHPPPPTPPSPVPKYSPAREWAARGAAMALGPPGPQQSCREEPDSPGPERSGRDERAAPTAARARERGPPRGEGRARGRGRGPRSTPDAAGRTRRWLGPLSGRRACQSLRTSANHGALRRAVGDPPSPAQPGWRAPGTGPTAKVSEQIRASAPPRLGETSLLCL